MVGNTLDEVTKEEEERSLLLLSLEISQGHNYKQKHLNYYYSITYEKGRASI